MANAVGMKDAKVFNYFPFWKNIEPNIVIANEEVINTNSVVTKDFVNNYDNTVIVKVRVTVNNGYDVSIYGVIFDETSNTVYSFDYGRTQTGYPRTVESVFILPKGYKLRLAFRNWNSSYTRTFTVVIDVIEIIQEV